MLDVQGLVVTLRDRGLSPRTIRLAVTVFFGSQSRNNEFEKLNDGENLQRFRRSSLVGRLAQLAPLAHLAGLFLYPDLTPALSLPTSPGARPAHNPKVAGWPALN